MNNRITDARARSRQLCAVAAVVLALAVAPPAAATIQHEGMPMPAKPRAKAAAKRRTTAKAAPRRAVRGRTTRGGVRPTRPVGVPTAPPAASDPHAGHTMTQPAVTPTTQTPGAQQHEGQQMPAQPPPAPNQQQPTAPAVDHSMHQTAQPQAPVRRRASAGVIPEGPVMTLDQLEKMAAENNPTLAQAAALVRVAEGRRRQAGAFPNPVVGYFGEELAFRAAGETSEHGVFVEQTIPLGGKLGKARRVFEREREQAEAIAEAQRLRVLNSVRMLYVEALGAQQLVELRADLANLAREAVEITKELYNVGQADRPDQLEIEIEAERAEIEMLRAQGDWEGVWRSLGAMVGSHQLQPARLAGSLEAEAATLDQEQILATLLRDSPEIRTAQIGVERARAVLARARAGRVPDLFVRGGVGYNNEILDRDGRKTGAEGQIEVGVIIPIFNRNRGGIAAAEAELAVAEREQHRLQLVLRSRLASSFRAYQNARQTVEKYRTRVIPRARQAYEMYLGNFRQMAASYPQVLIAQRTLFQVEVEYARAITELRRGAVGLRGFLLTGGLEAVGMPGDSSREGTEGFLLRSPNDASGDSDNR